MALSPSSRYTMANDSIGRAITKQKVVGSSHYAVVMSKGRQTFAELAAIHLGDPQLYWRIAGVNPHVAYPDEIPYGTLLRIPQG